eukprot:snap_masked-scaffold_30-processed-gene-2.7-mRNA-1 protein AED:1.00 eAED:1.00 QI:0/0/0/0/1/1/2/0/67
MKEVQWTLQGVLNYNPLTYRGYPKKSLFELIYDEEVKFTTIISVNLKLGKKDMELQIKKKAQNYLRK